MEDCTPVASLAGGILIGIAASMLLVLTGKIAGISGILAGALSARPMDAPWRLAFLAGLGCGGLALALVAPGALAFGLDRSVAAVAAAGLLVGFGTRLGNGCTSGHGVCGLSRGSVRSLIAVASFMVSGAVTVLVVNRLLGGAV